VGLFHLVYHPTMQHSSLDFGHLVEGVIEQDPLTDLYGIRVPQKDGTVKVFNVQSELAKLAGQEVRLTLVSFETLEKVAKMVEEAGTNDAEPS
jgi:hypothetical protein